MADFNTLWDFRSGITGIVHHLPGRVRLWFSPGHLKHADQIDLAAFENHGTFIRYKSKSLGLFGYHYL
ncbi:MAG: hypothetical protein JRI57_06275 [Deltaproteobacteria bacterium]|nr:hypothetical protein [Deltaproteobacteria bacterium]